MSRENLKSGYQQARAKAKKKREAEGKPLTPLVKAKIAANTSSVSGASGGATPLPPVPPTEAELKKAEDWAAVRRLAAMDPLERAKTRVEEAKKLGIPVTELDRLVRAERSQGRLQGSDPKIYDLEPWPTKVNGAEVLHEVANTFNRFVVLPEGAANIIALWCAHANVYQAFSYTPRLHISSPTPDCGKTTLRDLINFFVTRAMKVDNMTTPVLFRIVERDRPTILADECHGWVMNNPEIIHMFCAGQRYDGLAWRCVGEDNEPRAFKAFAPAVLCNIGSLRDDLASRAITIHMKRARPGELKARFDPRWVDKEKELGRKLMRFCFDNEETLRKLTPRMPESANNRRGDNWRPLFAIAEMTGGTWPSVMANAYQSFNSQEDIENVGIYLLEDIREALMESNWLTFKAIPTAELVSMLHGLPDSRWLDYGPAHRPIDANQLAKRLKPFGIKPTQTRVQGKPLRSYWIGEFGEAFGRYLPPLLQPDLQL
jgi:putative DNA primase/helicase